MSSIAVNGRSLTRRANLWSYHEVFDTELCVEKGYGVADALHHIALVCLQDKPSSLERLNFALAGGLAYTQDPLWPE